MPIDRLARPVSLIITGLGVVVLIGAVWVVNVKPDTDAYWLAAQRLRSGADLYLPASAYADEIEIYRYAPWFAYAWVPLTYLPQEVAYALWRGLLVLGAVAAVVPMLRRLTPASLCLALLTFGLLLSNVPAANVTALLVGGLALSLPGRAGPAVLGLAGSLKVFPLILVAGYVAERRWRDAAVAVGVAAVLWSHVFLFDVGGYPTEFGGVGLYRVSPLVWAVVVAMIVVLVGWLAWRRSRWTWLAAAAAIPLSVPRIWLPDAAYVSSVVRAVDRRSRGHGYDAD